MLSLLEKLFGLKPNWYFGLKHPQFWPGFVHEEGSWGFVFNKTGDDVPWETTQLNMTSNQTFDYSYIQLHDPPRFIPYEFEIFDFREWCAWGMRRWPNPFIIGFLYLTVIFAGEKWMINRKPFNLKWPLFVWNLVFGVFSIIGFTRVAPEFFSILMGKDGFYKGVCYRDGGHYPMAFWSLLFVLSKYIELGDTVFIILRKKPLVFIQWYHHFVTMIMSALSGAFIEPIARWYVVMNYGVHSLMYPYFALHVLGVRIPKAISIFITMCQLTQMLIGLFINILTAMLIRVGIPCYRHPFTIKLSFIVYGSFTILFSKLFFDVIRKHRKPQQKLKST